MVGEPSAAEIQEASFVLTHFVKAWGLPLNPEDLDLMGYCVLRYAPGASEDWEGRQASVEEEIRLTMEARARPGT